VEVAEEEKVVEDALVVVFSAFALLAIPFSIDVVLASIAAECNAVRNSWAELELA